MPPFEKNPDDLTPTQKIRVEALEDALYFLAHNDDEDAGHPTVEQILGTAAKFEAYIKGGL